ncbi:hypothetical protein KSC_025430 [Ktedonobacter sp. SOSP1-52]|uniref:DUF5134 domain-containing protein n=1 Tax=Ktedonobacter sp. SOSP1-52 TaxID=2778366 RepID=UPI001915561F|nr:DUF5134 domain-containing protein [Ktedonobacter sp. SOSP1-52]GHO63651.1 hypothetical protein KSC_025430 [Ktedonobacter sp. SOSP1-52]
MTTGSPLSTIFSLLFLIIAFFYLFRIVSCRTLLHPFDVENEVGHGLMAVGMMFMLAPTGWLSPYLIRWNVILFALFALWFIGRLFTRKPLLALVQQTPGAHSTLHADALHVLMHGGMCYMFLLMSSMVLSMMQPAIYTSYVFCISFLCLTLFYGKEVLKDLQAAKIQWLQCGANLAHTLMSGGMGWMFLEMISMTMSMGR